MVGLVGVDPPTLGRSRKYYLVRGYESIKRPIVWYRLLTGRYKLTSALLARLRGQSPESRERDDAYRWAREALEEMVARDVRLLLVITRGARERYNYATQLFDLFPGIGLERVVRVALLPTADHTFSREVDKTTLVSEVSSWLDHTRWTQAALGPVTAVQQVLDLAQQ